MRRKITTMTLISVLLVSFLLAASVPSLKAADEEPQIQWSKTYTPLSGHSLAQTTDGGYVIAGQQADWKEFEPHSTSGWVNKTAVLIKVDESGNLQWTKTYGAEVGGGLLAHSVVETMDSGFAIIGFGGQGVFLIKTDADGNIQWNTTIVWSWETMLWGGIPTSDGSYIIVGTSERAPGQFGWLLKIDENGNALWNRTFGDSDTSAFAVSEADDGGYVVAGNWENYCWFAKTDANGNLQWNRTYNFRYNDEIWYTYTATSIAKTSDGGYILGGGNNNRGFLVKTNSEGEMEWNRPYEDDRSFASVVQATSGDGYFAVGGFSYPSDYDVWFVRLDSSGNLLWNSTYDIPREYSEYQNAARSAIKTSDGGYAVTGARNGAIWLVKVAPETTTPTDTTPTAPPDNTTPPNVLVIVVSAVIIVTIVGIGILIYFKKRKHQSASQ